MEGNVEEEKQNKSKEMYDELVKEPLVLEYFEKELALNKMLEDVNSIFMNGVRDIYSEEAQIEKEYIYNNLLLLLYVFFNFYLSYLILFSIQFNFFFFSSLNIIYIY